MEPASQTQSCPTIDRSGDPIRIYAGISIVADLVGHPPIPRVLLCNAIDYSRCSLTILFLGTPFGPKVIDMVVCPDARRFGVPALVTKFLDKLWFQVRPLVSYSADFMPFTSCLRYSSLPIRCVGLPMGGSHSQSPRPVGYTSSGIPLIGQNAINKLHPLFDG